MQRRTGDEHRASRPLEVGVIEATFDSARLCKLHDTSVIGYSCSDTLFLSRGVGLARTSNSNLLIKLQCHLHVGATEVQHVYRVNSIMTRTYQLKLLSFSCLKGLEFW